MSDNPSYADRVRGCLYGGAVGDAFGYAVEFDRWPQIQARYGEKGIREPELDPQGRFIISDDTQMTLFTIDALLSVPEHASDADLRKAFRSAYLDWLRTQNESYDLSANYEGSQLLQYEELWHCRAPGNTCLSSLHGGGLGTIENPVNKSKGCGGVMRVAPIGLMRHWSVERCFDVAAMAAAITHGHSSGFVSAAAMGGMVRMMIDGIALPDAAKAAIGLIEERFPEDHEVRQLIHAALDAAIRNRPDYQPVIANLGEGWVGDEALAIALYAALAGNSFPEVLAIGANHSGDSDSTASIAGQLYGAWRGGDGLPEDWRAALDVKGPLGSVGAPKIRS
jgi:ADP-ribosyl-[dinitrogen reductase] hydrolase